MSAFYGCVPYYGLPEFPKSCIIVKNHEILPRDILLCNKTNITHIQGGMQYDPNIENGEYRICEPPTRRNLQKKADDYGELYLIFRTRYIQLRGASKYLVTGFYNVKKEFEKEEREGPIIYAENMRFATISDSIDITKQITGSRAFRSFFTSRNERWKKNLTEWVDHLEEKEDQTSVYIREINRLKKIFEENEFQDRLYSGCESCKHNDIAGSSCPLIWRKRTYRHIPNNAAHYMRNLDEFYESIV